jgi:hypothetical protein
LLSEVPVRTILRIRDDNPESFEAYRSTLAEVIRDHIKSEQPTTAKEAKEIYQDVLYPRVAQLHAEAARQRAVWLRKSIGTAAFAVGVISLGATGVLQSPQVLTLLGGATAKAIVDQIAETNVRPVTSSSLYFLASPPTRGF